MPCLWCYFLGLSPWVKLLLLFSPIHWEKLFLFQRLAVHCIWCSAVLLPRLPAQRRNSTARISSKLQQSAAIVTAMFSLCDAFLAFCFVLPLCRLCGEGGWPNSWPCGLFPELFTEFSTNLSDHCRVVADVALSQRLKLSQSLERCWGVQEWSVRWIVLHGVHQWHKDRRYHRKALPWPATRHMDVLVSCVEVLHLRRTRPPGSNHRREEALPGRWGMWVRKGTQPAVGWIMNMLQ